MCLTKWKGKQNESGRIFLVLSVMLFVNAPTLDGEREQECRHVSHGKVRVCWSDGILEKGIHSFLDLDIFPRMPFMNYFSLNSLNGVHTLKPVVSYMKLLNHVDATIDPSPSLGVLDNKHYEWFVSTLTYYVASYIVYCLMTGDLIRTDYSENEYQISHHCHIKS